MYPHLIHTCHIIFHIAIANLKTTEKCFSTILKRNPIIPNTLTYDLWRTLPLLKNIACADIPVWMEKSYKVPFQDKEPKAINVCLDMENQFSPGTSSLIGYSVPSGQP